MPRALDSAEIAAAAVRWAPRLAGAAYLLGAALLAVIFLRSPNGLLADTVGVVPSLVSGPALVPLIVWGIVGLGLLRGWMWAALLALLGFPILIFVSSRVGVDLSSADGVVQFFSPETVWWPLAGRVPFEVLDRALSRAPLHVLTPAPRSWWTYGANTALVLPALIPWLLGVRGRVRAARLGRERRRTLRLPAEPLEIYEKNAYQMLGLVPGETSTRRLMRRRGEIDTLLAAEMPIGEHLSDLFRVRGLGPDPELDEAAVSAAIARLQDEPDRIAEELLWFRLDAEENSVLDALRAGDLDSAEAAWAERRNRGSASERAAALANLAVLAHARALAKERELSSPARVADHEAWTRSLALWREVHEADSCWEHFALRQKRSTDPRVDDFFIQGLRRSLPARVLKINLELARSAALQGHEAYARAQLDLVRCSGLGDVDATLGAFLEPMIVPLRALLRPLRTEGMAALDRERLAEIAKAYEELRTPIVLLGGTAQLRDVVDESLAAAKRALRTEVNTVANRFSEADLAWWRGNQELIEEWNFYDRQLAGNRHLLFAIREKLLDVLRRMRSRTSAQAQAHKKLKAVESMEARIKRLVVPLSVVAKDSSDDLRKEIAGIAQEVTEIRTKASTEYRKTQEHYQRNVNGMASALGS